MSQVLLAEGENVLKVSNWPIPDRSMFRMFLGFRNGGFREITETIKNLAAPLDSM